MSRASAAFYCVADARYFLGAVAMINSLRLNGHREPIYLLDAGLSDDQRELLGSQATIVAAPSEAPPYLLKTVAPLAHPAEVMVLIDVDMIVTRPLGELIERAAEGRIVAFENNMDRFVEQWGELTGLGEARRGPYVSSGLVIAGAARGRQVIELMHALRGAVDFERTLWRRNDPSYPFLYADQDVLNAILRTAIEPGDLIALDTRLAPTQPFSTLQLGSARWLHPVYPDGSEPILVHHVLPTKPWLQSGQGNVYTQLLSRALAPGLAIEVESDAIPLWLRRTRAARLDQRLIDAREQIHWRVGGLYRALLARVRPGPNQTEG